MPNKPNRRDRYVVRFHTLIHGCLQRIAEESGSRVGTVTNSIVAEQTAGARSGKYHISGETESYILTHAKTERAAGPQVSVYMSDIDKKTIEQLVERTGSRAAYVITNMVVAYLEENGYLE